jgi:hypothetical protein
VRKVNLIRTRNSTRCIAIDSFSRRVLARCTATAYFAVLTFLVRLHQIFFIQEQMIAILSAKTVNFAINKLLAYRDRRGAVRADSASTGDSRFATIE